jgi:hypothetical protein
MTQEWKRPRLLPFGYERRAVQPGALYRSDTRGTVMHVVRLLTGEAVCEKIRRDRLLDSHDLEQDTLPTCPDCVASLEKKGQL